MCWCPRNPDCNVVTNLEGITLFWKTAAGPSIVILILLRTRHHLCPQTGIKVFLASLFLPNSNKIHNARRCGRVIILK